MTINPENLSKTQLEKLLLKWGKPAQLKKIEQNPLVFYETEGLYRHPRTKTLAPFVSKGLEAGIKAWNVPEFKKYTEIAAAMLRASTDKLDVLRTTFTQFKNVFRKYHSEDGERFASLKNTLSLTPEENSAWVKRSETNLKKKTSSQVNLTQKTIENFINAVAFNSNSDIIDKIITCQVCSGARMIEILSRKVSNFTAAPNSTDMIRQIGVAKTKGVDPNRVVVKPLVVISQERFLNNIKDITAAVGNIENTSNVTLGKRWNGRVNTRIKAYWTQLGVKLSPSDLKEVGNSHGMRRLYINYAYSNRKNRNMSKQLFISRYLGHQNELSSASANYDSVHIETKSVLTKNQAAQVNQAVSRSVENKEDIENLKKGIVKTQVEQSQSQAKRTIAISEKQKKFAKIEKLLSKGKTTYSQMQDAGISTYTFSQYRKEKGLQTESHPPSKSVAEVVKELKKDGKKPTYSALRAAGGFTNKQIKDWKDRQK